MTAGRGALWRIRPVAVCFAGYMFFPGLSYTIHNDKQKRGYFMKIMFYNTKPYDRYWFEPMAKDYGFEIRFVEMQCNEETLFLAKGYDAVCIFVNDYVNAAMIKKMQEMQIRAILLRCAGYNNVDIKAAEGKVHVLRVPSYSPEAVAEFAAALLLSVNRFTHRAIPYQRISNMNINGFMGTDLYKKTAGIVESERSVRP